MSPELLVLFLRQPVKTLLLWAATGDQVNMEVVFSGRWETVRKLLGEDILKICEDLAYTRWNVFRITRVTLREFLSDRDWRYSKEYSKDGDLWASNIST